MNLMLGHWKVYTDTSFAEMYSSLWQCRKDYSLSSSQVAAVSISGEVFGKCLEGNGGKARKIQPFQTQTLIPQQPCLEKLNGRDIIEIVV